MSRLAQLPRRIDTHLLQEIKPPRRQGPRSPSRHDQTPDNDPLGAIAPPSSNGDRVFSMDGSFTTHLTPVRFVKPSSQAAAQPERTIDCRAVDPEDIGDLFDRRLRISEHLARGGDLLRRQDWLASTLATVRRAAARPALTRSRVRSRSISPRRPSHERKTALARLSCRSACRHRRCGNQHRAHAIRRSIR